MRRFTVTDAGPRATLTGKSVLPDSGITSKHPKDVLTYRALPREQSEVEAYAGRSL